MQESFPPGVLFLKHKCLALLNPSAICLFCSRAIKSHNMKKHVQRMHLKKGRRLHRIDKVIIKSEMERMRAAVLEEAIKVGQRYREK